MKLEGNNMNGKLKRVIALAAIFIVGASTLTGCAKIEYNNDKLTIITTLFPQYDFVKQIGGDKVEVILITKPGVETHAYEPTPTDIIKINNADLFIYTGEYMEPWAQTVIDSVDNDKLYILDASDNIELFLNDDDHENEEDENEEEENEEEENEEEHSIGDGHNHEFDPHIWTDPINAKTMVDNILGALNEIDSENAEFYTTNANSYKAQLDELDNTFKAIMEKSEGKKIVFGGRFAFAYFAKRYDLEYVGAYDSCAADEDPSVKRISEIISLIGNENIPVIYYEELVEPKVAKSIAEETGIKALLLHSGHNVSKSDFDSGITYIEIMQQNAENLREGLK
jgi:zinc transport system substrate-binding protein